MRLYVVREAKVTIWLVLGAHGYKGETRFDLSLSPLPTLAASGLGSYNYWIEDDGMIARQPATDKPPYRVPSMNEIAALPWNGYSAISTFSGCGGSSLGYKMAGFKVLWANEFIPAAQEVYRLNHSSTILDTRDIRIVQPEEILEAIGMGVGDLDLFDGSPPCASFSTAGKREAGWGKIKQYSDTKQRTDDLFFEYVRLLKGVQPKVFVAENVSGLVKGTAKGYFKEILAAFKACGYNVKAQLLDAQWLGVPQMRQRIIFMGVRNDLGLAPVFPTPLPYRYSVRDALPWIVAQGDNGGFGGGAHLAATEPSPTIGTGPQTGNGRFPPSLVEVFVEDANGLRSAGRGVGHVHPNVTDAPMPTVQAQRPVRLQERRAYRDTRGAFGNDGDITDQPASTVLADSVGTHWIVENETAPTPEPAQAWARTNAGEAFDYSWSKRKIDPNAPGLTIGAMSDMFHPTEKRKFSIAELKRICAFPDDFQLTGSYAQQWERLGRAVPPVMMAHIAIAIRDQILCKIP
jgi:DNA (cytosine-5)-methyltransferase 1